MTELVSTADCIRIVVLALALPLVAVLAAYADRVLPRRVGDSLFWIVFGAGVLGGFRWDGENGVLTIVQGAAVTIIAMAALTTFVLRRLRRKLIG